MKSTTGVMTAVKKRLKKKDLSREASESVLGLLSALHTVLDDNTVYDENSIMRLADAFADNSSLLALIQQQAAELDALKRITLNLTTSLELQDVLDGVVAEAMHLVKDAHDAHIFLYQNQKIEFGASLQADGVKNKRFSEPRPNGLTYHIARTREFLIVEDMTKHPLYQNMPGSWSGSIIGIPLKMGSRVIGVMNLARNRAGQFSQSDIRLLTLLSDQASIAIINARLHQAVSQQARIDVLTNLPNRRALDERLEDEIKRSVRSGHVFSVIMMDLDGFKLINDTYGHDIGDDVLRQVALSLQNAMRSSDFLARYGGDEMTLVLSATDLNQAKIVARKINRHMENLVIQLPGEKTTKIGVSGGIAIYPEHAKNAPGLIRAADEALYRAKRSGGGSFKVALSSNA